MTIGAIAGALAKAQAEIRNAAKDAANPFFKSHYAPLDTVIDCLKASLAKNEIAYFQSPRSEGAKVTIVTRLIHSSGEWLETDPLEATVKDAAPQSIGSATTYLRRYSLMTAVGIAASEDDDAEAGEGRDTKPQHKPHASNEHARAAVQKAAAKDPIAAFKESALKEAATLVGSETRAKSWLCGIREDPKAQRAWSEADVEKVKGALALLRAKTNTNGADEFGLEANP
jgi:hypothetical protein